ncbi:signal peptidase I [Candidatus Woesearchaeota archaeon]|nr:signal peptidase I [Candidatus Woesearchaeota archaeon]
MTTEMGKIFDRARELSRKGWHFFWEEDSIWSWLANIVVAFLIIKFIVYPLLGLAMGTSYPLVAVVSESMEHGLHDEIICGQVFDAFPESLSSFWNVCGQWYEQNGITKEEFKRFPFRDGVDKGDVILLWRAHNGNIKRGDILVFQGNKPQPIIHRVIKIWKEDGTYYYQTKGDHNSASIAGVMGETRISESRVYGKGIIRIPYLGWVKILAVDAARLIGIKIER